ncbi:hypothetical protein [Streptomyces sp. Root264]|uniref:hypothetical protein n=1 Tax=Streptomyces sp. Root264 TaxID=1736503 RepID=UPI0007099E5E|nr:hypothetical protein [Streptomyces sp. Root264]KRD17938.1 hypothetical protein ASE41_20765 [Streptomyces sp. Root264]
MTSYPPPTPGIAQRLRPFGQQPKKWQRRRSRAVRGGHICCGSGCARDCEPVLVRERTGWGWIDWNVPADGSLPQQPHRIAVFAPKADPFLRLGLRLLARRPAHHICLGQMTVATATATAVLAAFTLAASALVLLHGLPLVTALSMAASAPLLVPRLPGALDARAGEHARVAEAEPACRYLHRLAALHTHLVHAADASDAYELRRSVDLSRRLLFDAAGLLRTHDTCPLSTDLVACERLMVQLADQVARFLQRTAGASPGFAAADQARGLGRPSAPHPPGVPRLPWPEHKGPVPTPPLKAIRFMTQPQPLPPLQPEPEPEHGAALRIAEVYLLFAHEPYYPGPAPREVNTTVVAAATLLHPRVRQPDGARIHDRLTQGRRPGQIIPLATLTHELNGGAHWPRIGDWERVTTDVVQLVQTQRCDALSLALPEIARALICTGPDHQVRAFDAAAGDFTLYGPRDRAEVLAEIGTLLTAITTEQPFWPGGNLLPPLCRNY